MHLCVRRSDDNPKYVTHTYTHHLLVKQSGINFSIIEICPVVLKLHIVEETIKAPHGNLIMEIHSSYWGQ